MPKKETKTLLLRLSPALWEGMSKWADDELRSINGQIEYVLRDALIKHKRLPRHAVGMEPESGDADELDPQKKTVEEDGPGS